jgi:hypothetical protein
MALASVEPLGLFVPPWGEAAREYNADGGKWGFLEKPGRDPSLSGFSNRPLLRTVGPIKAVALSRGVPKGPGGRIARSGRPGASQKNRMKQNRKHRRMGRESCFCIGSHDLASGPSAYHLIITSGHQVVVSTPTAGETGCLIICDCYEPISSARK